MWNPRTWSTPRLPRPRRAARGLTGAAGSPDPTPAAAVRRTGGVPDGGRGPYGSGRGARRCPQRTLIPASAPPAQDPWPGDGRARPRRGRPVLGGHRARGRPTAHHPAARGGRGHRPALLHGAHGAEGQESGYQPALQPADRQRHPARGTGPRRRGHRRPRHRRGRAAAAGRRVGAQVRRGLAVRGRRRRLRPRERLPARRRSWERARLRLRQGRALQPDPLHVPPLSWGRGHSAKGSELA
jgi:hypothetical protein